MYIQIYMVHVCRHCMYVRVYTCTYMCIIFVTFMSAVSPLSADTLLLSKLNIYFV